MYIWDKVKGDRLEGVVIRQKRQTSRVTNGVNGETLSRKEITGAPGRTRTRDTRFKKPNTPNSDSPTK